MTVFENHTFIGIDPGFSGGFGVISPGAEPMAFDMPVKRRGGGDGYNALDLTALKNLIIDLGVGSRAKFGLENPTTRPGEGAERSFRFGKQIGNLEAMILAFNGDLTWIPPATWTNKMGFCGKQNASAIPQRVSWWDREYPAAAGLIRGPLGGILDGRLDALLIAAYLKQISQGAVGKWGRRPPKFLGGGFDV